ncbi:MAG: HPr family phosphocarrier protein [Candidatus Omnitrophica bacterium]|nr:HPr family phosphocarrier protein [Candidatus Omnitrophota bacterium]
MVVEKRIVIKNESGLHARPASLFVQIANKYDCEITVKKGKQKVNGKSIMGIMMLAAEKGSKVTIVAEGDDAEHAVKELESLLLSETLENFDAKKEKK